MENERQRWRTFPSFIYRFSIYYSLNVEDIRKYCIFRLWNWIHETIECCVRVCVNVDVCFRYVFVFRRHRFSVYLLHLRPMLYLSGSMEWGDEKCVMAAIWLLAFPHLTHSVPFRLGSFAQIENRRSHNWIEVVRFIFDLSGTEWLINWLWSAPIANSVPFFGHKVIQWFFVLPFSSRSNFSIIGLTANKSIFDYKALPPLSVSPRLRLSLVLFLLWSIFRNFFLRTHDFSQQWKYMEFAIVGAFKLFFLTKRFWTHVRRTHRYAFC